MEKKNGKTAEAIMSKKDLDLIAAENRRVLAAKKPVTKAEMKVKIDAAEKALDASKKTTAKETPKKGNGKGGFKANPNSKANKIRLMFKEKREWPLKEMTKRSGFKNEDNTRCQMSIFKNPTRTKDLLITEFNKERQTYSLSK